VYGDFSANLYIQQDATLHSLFISGNCSTRFGWYFHPSSGADTTVSTASGICHTVTAICRYRGRVGTGLSVLWVAYATSVVVREGAAGLIYMRLFLLVVFSFTLYYYVVRLDMIWFCWLSFIFVVAGLLIKQLSWLLYFCDLIFFTIGYLYREGL
jgi:hypothetical protein